MNAQPKHTAESYEVWAASRTFPRRSTDPQWEVDWSDRPGKFCVIPGATKISLRPEISRDDLAVGMRSDSATAISVDELSDLLLLCAGILRRKLSIIWSRKNATFDNGQAPFGRGVASGGGLYPYCLYIVSRADHTLQRGVYHYDVAHHALHRVQIGDCSAELSAIFEDSHAEDADILFVLAGRFWQAAFKYGQFAYKVMMQDMGAFLGGMEHVAWSLGWDAKMIYWFKDRALSDLLGLDEQLEAPFFVVSARARRPPGERHGSTETAFAHGRHLAHAERSRHVKQIRLLLDVHSSTCVDDASSRPPPISDEPPIDSYHDTIGPLAGANLIETFLNRETCWGQTVDQSPAFRVDQLLTTIAFGFSSVAYAADVYSSARGLPLLHVDVLVRNVEGLPAGVYRHDATSGKLTVRRTGLPDDLFRRIYRAKEHNTEQMPVALVLTGKLRDAIDHFGQRGIRVMNAEAGMFAQRAYLACSALSLGCGAVLGFDGVALSAALGLDTAKEVPLLLIFVGARRPRTTAFDFRLV